MKINEKGEVVLSSNEWKVGNFVIKNEENHIKIVTANAPAKLPLWSIRFRKDMTISSYIILCAEHLSDEKFATRLHNWLAVIFNATCIIPDLEEVFLEEIIAASDKALEKNKHLYMPDVSDEENNEILDELKANIELSEEIDNLGTL